MVKKSFKGALKKLTALFLCALMLLPAVPAINLSAFAAGSSTRSAKSAAAEPRLDLNFNKNWKFYLGDAPSAMAKAFDDSAWGTVQLPHDFSISQDFTTAGTETESGNLPGGTGWYRKMFTMPADFSGKEIILNFDGAYNNAYVYVNGELVCENHYGYNSFSVNISDYITCNGSTWNFVAVKVVAEEKSSRWYPGAGLYRDVTMTILNPVHVSLYGTHVTTPTVSASSGTMDAVVTVQNESLSSSDVTVTADILDSTGNTAATETQTVNVASGASADVSFSMTVSNPSLWDTENPNLYTLRTTLTDASGNTLDVYDTDFGFRTIEWNVDTGFYLNGNPIKIKGMCMHHDQGALGAVQEYDAIYRQVKILKDMGCNAIRTSHNIPSRILLEICNELGMLVMEEFFDGWAVSKNGNSNDFSKYFNVNIDASNNIIGASSDMTWAQFALTSAVKRDRNDPCVVIWSAGNELENGTDASVAAKIKGWLEPLDATRPLTYGNNTRSILDVDGYMDVIGGNYRPEQWASLKESGGITKPYIATEYISTVTSRGVYSYSYTDPYYGGQVGNEPNTLYSYDNSYVGWGSSAAYGWYYTIKNDWTSGEFVWTGFDYIGEPTPWNSTGQRGVDVPNSAYFGVIDTAGFPKDQFYLYRSLWQTEDTTLHLLPGTWNSENLYMNNGYAYVNVYSNADHIELLLNGNVIATAQSTTTVPTAAGYSHKTWTETIVDANNCNTNEIFSGDGHDLYAQFGVKYAEGTLSVKAYDAAGNEITNTVGTKSVSSGKSAAKIVAKVWGENGNNFTADSDSFAYIEFEAVDENGNFVNDYNGTLNISLNDGGVIVGVDNGYQGTTDKYQQSTVLLSDTTATIQMFNGKALAIVRTTEIPTDDIAVTATTSDNLDVVGATFTSRAETGDELTDEFEEVIIQSDQPYSASQYDRYDLLQKEVEALDTVIAERYVFYSVPDTGTVKEVTSFPDGSIPDGDYIITGAGWGDLSKGTLTHTTATNGSNQGLSSDSSKNIPPTADADTWHFEKQSVGTDYSTYYIYYLDESGTAHYMSIPDTASNSSGNISLSDTPVGLQVKISGSTITIGNGSQYVNYYGSVYNFVSTYSDGTNLTLYMKPVIEDGVYVIYNLGYAMSATPARTNSPVGDGLDESEATVNGDILETDSANEYTFTNTGESPYTYYIRNASGQYLNIGSGQASLTFSDTAQSLTVVVQSDGTVLIHNGDQYLDHYDGEHHFANWNDSGASNNRKMSLYRKEVRYVFYSVSDTDIYTKPVIEDGVYIIANIYNSTLYVASGSLASGTTNKISHSTGTLTDNVLETDSANEYTFTNTGESAYSYYIQNSQGQYLNIGTGDTSVSFSDTPQALTVAVLDDGTGRIGIYNGDSQFIDNYSDAGVFSSWTSTVSGLSDNRKMSLYRKETASSPEKAALYTALTNAVTYAPGTYDSTTYNALLDAVESGLAVYGNENSTAEALTAAANAINEAIAGLTTSMKKFPARIIKYGYNPSATGNARYTGGGRDFNAQSVEAMKNAILANTDLTNQIKTIIDYDGTNGTVWTDTYADDAFNQVVTLYAELYTLVFTGEDMNGGTSLTNETGSIVKQTAWNFWAKNNTHGHLERTNEGASVQGLFSAYLDETTQMPVSHDAYNLTDGLSYLSGETRGITTNQTLQVSVDGTNTKEITLTPLNNISVYVPDFFSKNNVAGSAEGTYSKFYWETDFPFIMTTDEAGVNTYTYDAADTRYLLRAKYDDAAQTAQTELVETTDGWSVNMSGGAGAGDGLFPFNYQLDDDPSNDTLTGENAIYHYGMTFSTDFYVAPGGHYSGSTDDIIFNFAGDDDVLVYIDGQIVLDNGGLHGSRSCSINFTEASISYQYAMDVTEGEVKSTVENDVIYKYGEENLGISADNLAALELLNTIRNDTETHTFAFFYLERGSTNSNCKISFNLQQLSDHISLKDQALVADYGLPISYNVTANNTVSEEAKNNGASVNYIGIADTITETMSFTEPDNLTYFPESGIISGSGNYGDYTVNSDGTVTYNIKTTEFSGKDAFYLCAEVMNDPTYAAGTVYYDFEKITFIPATSVYYEDDFREGLSGGITYTNGTVPADCDNTVNKYGEWETVTDAGTAKAANQAADLVGDVNANVYGYDPAYAQFTSFSDASAHKVTVSAKNNPNSKYSGGAGSCWPEVQFTFRGTGFDLMSVTDCKTGIFTVEVYEGADTTGTRVKRSIVDTYYGYSYKQLYADGAGNPTGTPTDIPLYWTKDNKYTTAKTYYGENGVITNEVYYYDVSGNGYSATPTYYDASSNLTTEVTDNPAYSYAYAYGWIKDNDSSTDSLYQIPVIRIVGLAYNQYTVVVTPMFSDRYGHYETDDAGVRFYNLYVDGIRIYDPAGSPDSISDAVIANAYKTDGEAFADYIELRDMLIGTDSFGDAQLRQGVIFIDGIPALDNDMEKYKSAGPNNELYLSSGQAVAFEVWATAVPSDLQFSAKAAKGQPTVTISYNGAVANKTLTTAAEMYYSFNSLLPTGNKLKWTQTTVDGTAYYTTGAIVISNSAEQDTILSIGNIKWTFSKTGAQGYFRIPTEPVTETVALMSTRQTLTSAYTSVSAMYTDLAISEDDVTVENSSPNEGEDIVIAVETSDDVKTLLIKDADGNIVEPVSVEEVSAELETGDAKQWKVTLNESSSGTYVYTVTGVNEYGLEGSSPVEFTVTVSAVPEDEGETKSFLDTLIGLFERIIDFLKKLLGFFE